MKIWQLDPVSLTPYYDISLAESLADAGHEVRYITSRYLYDPALVYPSNITTDLTYFKQLSQPALVKLPIVRKALRGLLYPWGHVQVLRSMKRLRPDIVHIQWSRLPRIDRLFAASVKSLGIPLVHTIHDVEPLFMHGPFAGSLNEVYEPYIDAFIVHTEENRTRFLRHYPRIDPQKVQVIPLIVSRVGVRTTSPLPNRNAARAALSVVPSAFVVMFFGLIKPYKGLDVLAKAIPFVMAQHPNAEFWIVGKPDGEIDRQLLATLQNVDRVHIIPQYIPAEDVPMYHQAADIMVFPYHQISQSAALATALSFGSAVIVTAVGGLPDMVQGNGWVIPPNDPVALAKTIGTAINAPDLVADMRIRSHELIDGPLSPSAITRQHLALYHTLIERISR